MTRLDQPIGQPRLVGRKSMFRTLSPEEEVTFRQWARENYEPGSPINPLWHPIVTEECLNINDAITSRTWNSDDNAYNVEPMPGDEEEEQG